MPSNCALCGRSGDIRQSHIIPKFASKWIKRTSATGYLASAADGARRVQDGVKVSLLCGDCEELFSKSEKWFAENIFCPFHDKSARSFNYNKNLAIFAASLSWRALKMSHDEAVRYRPSQSTAIDRAEACLRGYLLGKRRSIEPYESHLVFMLGESSCGEFYANKWYTKRATDSTLAASKEVALAYSLLPRMAVVTSILPTTMEGWRGTSIKPSGKIGTNQRVDDSTFWRFVEGRASLALTLSPGPSVKEGERRLRKASEKNPSRVLGSETMKLVMEGLDSRRGKKMRGRGMPEAVVKLVEEVVIKSAHAGDPDASDSDLARWRKSQIAHALAGLTESEAEEMARKIENAVAGALKSCDCREVLIKASSIWVVFMVCHNVAKKAQHEKIRDAVESLRPRRGGVKTPIAVISMNVEGGGCSFELGSSLA